MEPNGSPLQEQGMFLTTELSSHPDVCKLICIVLFNNKGHLEPHSLINRLYFNRYKDLRNTNVYFRKIAIPHQDPYT